MPDQSEAPIVRPITERLLRQVHGYRGSLRHDGTVAYEENETEVLVNPDGPEAAEIIRLCEEALEKLTARWQDFQDSDSGNQADAYYTLVKSAYEDWKFARAALAQIKGQNP